MKGLLPLCLCAVVILRLDLCHAQPLTRLVKTIAVDDPGYAQIYEHPTPRTATERYSLMLSSHTNTPAIADETYIYKYIGKHLDGSLPVVHTLDDELTWPNEPAQVFTRSIFPFAAVVQPEGHLTDGNHNGGLVVINVTRFNETNTFDITRDPDLPDLRPFNETFFYHRVLFQDMNDDEQIDIVTNRARYYEDQKMAYSELVWLQNPDEANNADEQWDVRVINMDIGDTFLAQATLQADGRDFHAIFTVGYFSRKLAVHWTEHDAGSWENNNDVRSRVIAEEGRYYDVRVTDVNGDGKLDILTTLNEVSNGKVLVYEIPADFRSGSYKRHLIAEGFNQESGSANPGSPGQMEVFWPMPNMTRPWMLLSGHHDGRAYYLEPITDIDSWGYKRTVIMHEQEDRIEKLAQADVDGDGYAEVFIPSYDQHKLYIYTFSPAKANESEN